MKKNIIVLYGGKSEEHEVSRSSGLSILNAIDRDKYNPIGIYIDKDGSWARGEKNILRSISSIMEMETEDNNTIVFPALHGPYGEDGTVQGLLELVGLPYVGCNTLSSAISMDKVIMKDVLKSHGILQANYLGFNKEERLSKIINDSLKQIWFDCYVKPANMGSSIGISKCTTTEELGKGIKEALKYDSKIIIEKEIKGRELHFALIGNKDIKCSVAGEKLYKNSFRTYEDKYINESPEQNMPANISEEKYEECKKMAIKVYKIFNCSGLARVDIFIDDNNKIYLNEINTMPGLSENSIYSLLYQKSFNKTYEELINELIELAIENHEE